MKLQSLRQSRLGRNALWMLLGQLASFALQAAYFICLARLLNVVQYGLFAGAFAFVSTLMPYSALGAGMLFMRYVSLDKTQARAYWGNTLFASASLTLFLSGLLFFFGAAITGIHDPWMLLILAIANCFFNQIVFCASNVFQTYDRMRLAAFLRFSVNLVRLLVLLLILSVWHHATAHTWSMGLLLATCLSASGALIQVRRIVGVASLDLQLLRRRGWEGVGFAFAGSTQVAYNDLDKTMLTHYGMDAQSGFYSLAYKIIDFATVPIGSIDIAVLPRYFSIANGGFRQQAKLLRKVLSANVVLGLSVMVFLYVSGPLIMKLVGHGYEGAVAAMRILCVLPLFRGLHTGIGSMLTGIGYQPKRTVAQVSAAGLNLLINIWAIPHYGWRGAAYTSVITDGFLALYCIVLLMWVARKDRNIPPVAAAV